MGWRSVVGRGPKKLTLRKRHFFVIEEYVEDVKQEEKDVPDLVESIMKPTDPVKEELRRILMKMSQYRPEIIKTRASTFWMSGKSTDSRRRPTQPSRLVSFKPNFKKSKKMRVLARKGHYPSWDLGRHIACYNARYTI